MTHLYDKDIIQILLDVGDRGISMSLLAKHVYNMNCTFFSQPDIEEIKRQVRLFVNRNSQRRKPLLEHTGRWGFYRLNSKGRKEASMQLLEFKKEDGTEEDAEKPQQDFSLSLFGDEF